MKVNKLAFKKTLLSLLLLISTSYAQCGDVEPCVQIMDHFNKPALAALFKNKKEVKVTVISSSPADTSGCFVQTNIAFTKNTFDRVSEDIGSILLYKEPNNDQLYENDKSLFMPTGARLDWENTLPDVQEGFVSNAAEGYQAFNAYLRNGDYVIFIYKNTSQTKSTIDHLNSHFIDYINVMAQQVINNQNMMKPFSD